MQAMHGVKLPPLGGSERPENGMVEEFAAGAQLFLAAADDVVHVGNCRANFSENFFWGDAARTSDRRGFAAGGQVTESNDDQGAGSLSPSLGGSERVSGFGEALESFDSSGVR
jgi:hypothetical protein